jgi:hypothetical protein
MKSVLILAALALSSQAMALDSKMDLKGRFDYKRTETKNNNGTTTTKDSDGQYVPSFLKLATDVKFNDSTSAKLLLDFKEDQDAAARDNGLAKFVEEAYLTKRFGSLSAMVGKQAVLTGGRENDYSPRDLYLTSAFKSATVDNITGLTLGYEFAGQKFFAQHLENTTSNSGNLSDRKATGVAYYGSFFDGKISPIFSYHKLGSSRPGKYDTLSSFGVQGAHMNLVVEVDYSMYTQEKAGRSATTNAANSADAELTSMVAHVRYNHDNFKPFVKWYKEEGEGQYSGLISTNSAIKTERNAWELGLEYYPKESEDFRYHLVYNTVESKETTGTTKAKNEADTIYAGLAFGFNILK